MIKHSLLIILGFILMINVQASELKKPEFTLHISITGVGADVRLNDISIEFEKFSGHSTMTYDVNPFVISGVNELKVITFPFLGKTRAEGQTEEYHEEAEVKAALFVNEKGDESNKKMLTQIHILPGLPLNKAVNQSLKIEGDDDVVLDDNSQPLSFPIITFEKQIIATRKSLPVQSNYPRWAWQDGQTIEDTQENYDSLLSVYHELYEAFKNKDRNKLLSLHTSRSSEYAIAYYLSGGVNAGHDFMNTGGILDEEGVNLMEFSDRKGKLDIYADGKMARIINVAEYHPILFRNDEQGLVHKLKFGFYKNQQGEWILIR